jgi:hypothetical protein
VALLDKSMLNTSQAIPILKPWWRMYKCFTTIREVVQLASNCAQRRIERRGGEAQGEGERGGRRGSCRRPSNNVKPHLIEGSVDSQAVVFIKIVRFK